MQFSCVFIKILIQKNHLPQSYHLQDTDLLYNVVFKIFFYKKIHLENPKPGKNRTSIEAIEIHKLCVFLRAQKKVYFNNFHKISGFCRKKNNFILK